MSFARPIKVEEFYYTSCTEYLFNRIFVFRYESKKGYVDQVDLWITRAILKGLVNAKPKN